MADIAFNLVLFFVILAKTQDDSHIQWTAVQAPELKAAPSSRLVVSVDKEGKTYLNGKQMSTLGLEGAINAYLEENPADPKIVLLKIDKDTLAGTFETIIEEVSKTGCEIVHVLEEEQ